MSFFSEVQGHKRTGTYDRTADRVAVTVPSGDSGTGGCWRQGSVPLAGITGVLGVWVPSLFRRVVRPPLALGSMLRMPVPLRGPWMVGLTLCLAAIGCGQEGNGTGGVRGLDGIDGETGPAGPTGPRGPEGPEGPTGPSGAVGVFDPALCHLVEEQISLTSTQAVEASCAEDEFLVSGGCDNQGNGSWLIDVSIFTDKPLPGGGGTLLGGAWRCGISGSTGGSGSPTITAYAICCNSP